MVTHHLVKKEIPSRSQKSRVQSVRSVGCHDHFHLGKMFGRVLGEESRTFSSLFHAFIEIELETNLSKDIKAVHLVEQLHQCPL